MVPFRKIRRIPNWAGSISLAAVLALGAGLAQDPAPPQQGPPAGGGGAGGVGGAGGTGGTGGGNNPNTGIPGNTSPFPGRTPGNQQDTFPGQNRTQFPEMQRPVFLSGKVTLEDGSPPPESVVIERMCNGVHRPEGYTDQKGRFSIRLGENNGMMQDASVSSAADTFGTGGFGGAAAGNPGMGNSRGISERDLMGCELRASLPGYRSEVVNLSGRRLMDNPDVGIIILRKMGNVEGTTISMTTQMAPKDAKKSYEKGRELARKERLADAQKEYEKAVGLYPKYAIAWHELGLIYQLQDKKDPAKDAFAKALEADSKFVKPYLQLALQSAKEQKWQDVADTTSRVIRLNPVDFPEAFFYNSVANYNLQKFDEAEKSAEECVKLDTRHRMPKAQHMLGLLLAMRSDYKGAAENMKGYLKFAPQAGDTDMVKKQLEDVEKRLGQTEVVKKEE